MSIVERCRFVNVGGYKLVFLEPRHFKALDRWFKRIRVYEHVPESHNVQWNRDQWYAMYNPSPQTRYREPVHGNPDSAEF